MQVIREGLNETYQRAYDAIGEEAFLKLHDAFRGTQVNFAMRMYDSKKVAQLIGKEYDGHNEAVLAQRYGYSQRWVKQVGEQG